MFELIRDCDSFHHHFTQVYLTLHFYSARLRLLQSAGSPVLMSSSTSCALLLASGMRSHLSPLPYTQQLSLASPRGIGFADEAEKASDYIVSGISGQSHARTHALAHTQAPTLQHRVWHLGQSAVPRLLCPVLH